MRHRSGDRITIKVHRQLVIFALAGFVFHQLAFAVDGEFNRKIARAKQLYFNGVEGNDEALEKSAALLQDLWRESPSSPVINVYLGSIRLLQSGKTLAIWRKGKLAKQGLDMLDGAVAASPGDLEVLFVRAASTFHLPGFFSRGDQCESDFARIAADAVDAAQSGRLDRRLAAAALFFHGRIRERKSDHAGAAAAWGAAIRVGPDTRAGIDAARKLNHSEAIELR